MASPKFLLWTLRFPAGCLDKLLLFTAICCLLDCDSYGPACAKALYVAQSWFSTIHSSIPTNNNKSRCSSPYLNTNGGVSKNNKRGFHKTREFPPKQGGFNQNRGVSPEIKGVQTKQEFQWKKGGFQPKQESFTKSKKASPKTGEFQSKEGRFNQNYRVSTKRREGLLKIRVYHQKIRVFHQK